MADKVKMETALLVIACWTDTRIDNLTVEQARDVIRSMAAVAVDAVEEEEVFPWTIQSPPS